MLKRTKSEFTESSLEIVGIKKPTAEHRNKTMARERRLGQDAWPPKDAPAPILEQSINQSIIFLPMYVLCAITTNFSYPIIRPFVETFPTYITLFLAGRLRTDKYVKFNT